MSDNNNGFVGDWTHVNLEEPPAENVGPGHAGIESLAEEPSAFEKVTWNPAAPETGDGTSPPEGAEPWDGPPGGPPDDPAPPEAPVESLGPVGDGRCSPAEMPGLPEEVTGPVVEEGRGDDGSPAEAALSEEGLQVCQESRSEGSAPSSPSALSPSPSGHVHLISGPESHAPFSPHADACEVTSPCSDTDDLVPVDSTPDIDSAPELLTADIPAHDIDTHASPAPEILAADIPAHDIDTHASPAPEILAADIPAHDIGTHASPAPEILAADIPAHDIDTHASPAPEILAADIPAHDIYTHPSSAPESLAPVSSAPEIDADVSPAFEPPTPGSQPPAPVPSAPVLESQEGEEPQKEAVVPEPAHILADVAPPEDVRGDSGEAAEGDGLRKRHAPPPAQPEPPLRARDEEEEEEVEFHLVEKKKEEWGWFSLNQCIVGALVLLCLGSIIYTGYFLDLDDEEDFTPSSVQPPHKKQEPRIPAGKLPDPKEVSQLLGKLAEDNKKMAVLQREELDLVLPKTEETVKEPPTGPSENHTSVHSGKQEEQSVAVLAAGDTGQEAEKIARAPVIRVKEVRRTERVEKPLWKEREKKREWQGKVREFRTVGHQEKGWKKGREESKEWSPREERKEKRGESDWKHRKDGGKDQHREWKEKVEKRRAWETGKNWYKGDEKKNEGAWKDKSERKDQWRGEKKDWKAEKEGWKAQKDWREERGTDKSKKEKHWQGSAEKKPRPSDHVDYWKRQQEKLQRNRPPVGCRGIVECARKEGLVPVTTAEFQALLGSYLGKLGDDARGSGAAAVLSLVGEFFADGVFAHHETTFREFAEDVADVLEDLTEGGHRAEEEMEEFEREALRRFAVAGGGEKEGRRRG